MSCLQSYPNISELRTFNMLILQFVVDKSGIYFTRDEVITFVRDRLTDAASYTPGIIEFWVDNALHNLYSVDILNMWHTEDYRTVKYSMNGAVSVIFMKWCAEQGRLEEVKK